MEPRFRFSLSFFFLLLLAYTSFTVQSKCNRGCDLALASYNLWNGSNLTYISNIMKSRVLSEPQDIIIYNKDSNLISNSRVNVPFPCDCINGEFLSHTFVYQLQPGQTYTSVAEMSFSNLTNDVWMQRFNIYPPTNIPDFGMINVTLNCSCGNKDVSMDYGLFITYPLGPKDTLHSIANQTKLDAELLQRYNPGVDFSQGTGVVFIPAKDQNGSYVPLHMSTVGLAGGAIAGISVAVLAVVGLLLLSCFLYIKYYQKKKTLERKLILNGGPDTDVSTDTIGIMAEKSHEFSYKELANATNNFSEANKIGQGGFGEVYYFHLHVSISLERLIKFAHYFYFIIMHVIVTQKAAVKKMKMKASKEFFAELKVLTRVHHLNLVHLIGYCVEGSLLLVYEYIDNGNLSQNLRDAEREPLQWSTRMQIALDSARGLEYIHEHTVPVYIHRDIKSENILLDKNFCAKVADFGLSKLVDVGNSTSSNIMAGTFGYMPPEYAHGGVSPSPKIDVYAFGVVLYELISAKEAIIRSDPEVIGLVTMFDEAFKHQPDPTEGLKNLVDPKLGDNYSIDSVLKIAQLAKACTDRDPQQRPSMRSVVVALMTLTSTTEEWNISSFYENPAYVNLMSGK